MGNHQRRDEFIARKYFGVGRARYITLLRESVRAYLSFEVAQLFALPHRKMAPPPRANRRMRFTTMTSRARHHVCLNTL